jgi:PBP1b-binding outer membrane lipoprotein LpoB
MKRILVIVLLAMTMTGCAGMETWDSWDSMPTDGFWSVTPSFDFTRSPDGKYYGSGCITSRIFNFCDAAQSD